MVSRALKEIPNKQIQLKFGPVREYCLKNGIILDGEFYSQELTFQEITSFVMTEDLESSKTVKKNGGPVALPSHLKFYVFDSLINCNDCFYERLNHAETICKKFPDLLEYVAHRKCLGVAEVEQCFDEAVKQDIEGLILRDPHGRYKYGRGTLKEALIFKVKPFITFDAKVTGVVQSTEVREGVEKKVNELGRSVTSKKKDDRVLIEKASAFWVQYKGKDLKVTLAMTDPEKEEVWKNRLKYVGKTIEYKGMLVGAKDVPRHPTMLRFREDKD